MNFPFNNIPRFFSKDVNPKLLYPHCFEGILIFNESDFKVVETTASKKEHNNPDFEPFWVLENFTGYVKCNNSKCKDEILVVGTIKYEWDYSSGDGGDFERHFYPLFFQPTVPLFYNEEFSNYYETYEKLIVAFKLYWADDNACANAIGNAIEAFLTDCGIKQTKLVTSKKGESKKKRERLSLHERLHLFKEKHKDLADLLLKVKVLRNYGSHGREIEKDDINASLKALEYVFTRIWDNPDKKIKDGLKDFHKRYK